MRGIGCAMLLLGASSCFYTNPINERPVIRDIAPAYPVSRWDKAVTVIIDAFDPDGDRLTVDYDCPSCPLAGQSPRFTFRPVGPGQSRVLATATDSLFAMGLLEKTIEVPNKAP